MDSKDWRYRSHLFLLIAVLLFMLIAIYILERRIVGGTEVWRCVSGYGLGLGLGLNSLALGYLLSRAQKGRGNTALSVSNFSYEEVFHKGEILIHVIDLEGRILYVNQAWKDLLGYADTDLMQKNIFSVIDAECQSFCRQRLQNLLQRKEDKELFQISMRTKSGEKVILEGNCSLGYVKGKPQSVRALFRDISDRKVQEQHLLRLAYYDGLTGLPNRHLLPDRLRQAMACAARYAQYCAVVFLDLDGFKQVNDTLGHAQGDFLLRQVGHRLSQSLRENDTVSRIGGDEFVIVVTGLRELTHIAGIVHKLQSHLEHPFALEDMEFVIRASFGIAVYPDDGATVETLLARADQAMYAAKQNDKGGYRMYSTSRDLV
ncbi:MAG: sensor domain-containing diguanylate cyclase [Desulfuromonadaceae bacterium]|nr:sensor domain-containing diguanylate cyclase [Desulfuromonadaceae bacterium]